MRIVITGGAGFLGSHLCDALIDRGDAVVAVERSLGRRPRVMPHNNPGFDIHSIDPNGPALFIEVKGRIEGGTQFTVTQNELHHAENIPESYVLAMVEVSLDGPAHDVVRYLRQPFGSELRLPFDTTSANLDWTKYWTRAGDPA